MKAHFLSSPLLPPPPPMFWIRPPNVTKYAPGVLHKFICSAYAPEVLIFVFNPWCYRYAPVFSYAPYLSCSESTHHILAPDVTPVAPLLSYFTVNLLPVPHPRQLNTRRIDQETASRLSWSRTHVHSQYTHIVYDPSMLHVAIIMLTPCGVCVC